MTLKTLALIGVASAALGACGKTAATSAGGAAATPASASPSGAASAQHVRGTLQAVTPGSLAVRTYDGRSVTAPVDAKTGYAWVVKSSLSTLKDGDFIGTATTGPDTALRAVEVVIFPASMRGTGEGHYGWDTPGAIAAAGGGGSESGMTNGTVQSQGGMTNGTVQSQSGMTNGTVAAGAGPAGGRTLTVSYKGGVVKVAVPEGTPVVRFEPTQASVLAPGQKVFIVVPPGGGAKFVAIGKDGVTPPM